MTFALMEELLHQATDKNGSADYLTMPSLTSRSHHALLSALGGSQSITTIEMITGIAARLRRCCGIGFEGNGRFKAKPADALHDTSVMRVDADLPGSLDTRSKRGTSELAITQVASCHPTPRTAPVPIQLPALGQPGTGLFASSLQTARAVGSVVGNSSAPGDAASRSAWPEPARGQACHPSGRWPGGQVARQPVDVGHRASSLIKLLWRDLPGDWGAA
jgi:hypothetical protein